MAGHQYPVQGVNAGGEQVDIRKAWQVHFSFLLQTSSLAEKGVGPSRFVFDRQELSRLKLRAEVELPRPILEASPVLPQPRKHTLEKRHLPVVCSGPSPPPSAKANG